MHLPPLVSSFKGEKSGLQTGSNSQLYCMIPSTQSTWLTIEDFFFSYYADWKIISMNTWLSYYTLLSFHLFLFFRSSESFCRTTFCARSKNTEFGSVWTTLGREIVMIRVKKFFQRAINSAALGQKDGSILATFGNFNGRLSFKLSEILT